jgi:hypothetical protein
MNGRVSVRIKIVTRSALTLPALNAGAVGLTEELGDA